VASSIEWGIGEEKEGDISASTEELEAGRRRVTLAKMTNASERALPAVVADTEIGTVSLAPFSSAHARFVRRRSSLREPHICLPRAAVPRCCRRPRRRRPASHCCSLLLRKCLRCCTQHGMLQAPVSRAHTHA
jgi:hypothetical protein